VLDLRIPSEVHENFALLGCYAASTGKSFNSLSGEPIGPIFKDQESFWVLEPLKLGPIGFPETSVRNYYSVRNNAEENNYYLKVCFE